MVVLIHTSSWFLNFPRNLRMLGYRDIADILEIDKLCYSYHAINRSDNFEFCRNFNCVIMNSFSGT